MKVEKFSMFGSNTAKLFTDDGTVHVGLRNRRCSKCGEGDCAHVKYVFDNRAAFEKIGANFNGGTAPATPGKKAAEKKAVSDKRTAEKKAAQKVKDSLPPEAKAALDRSEKVRLEGVKEHVTTMPDIPTKVTKASKSRELDPSKKPAPGNGAIKETGIKKGVEVIAIHRHGLNEKDLTVHGFLREETKHKITVERKNSKELVEIEKVNLIDIVEAPKSRGDNKPAAKTHAEKLEEKGLPPIVEKKKRTAKK
ncbi:MAG: hypothetical protein A4E73_02407 [Syntrophaceae bacterium PtaU1.Bin231]|nr:MAG: hypothetical protein A4E73_02407 [Syntrophaceae bacterium PtaU1.Bin231]